MEIRYLGQITNANNRRSGGCSSCGNGGLGRSGVRRINRKTVITSSMAEYNFKAGQVQDIPQADALELLAITYRVGGHLYNLFEVV